MVTAMTLTPNDGTTNGTANSTTQITATSVNDVPVLGGTFTTAGTVSDDVAIDPFSGVTVSDPDTGALVSVSITYPAANGTLSGTGLTGSAGNSTLTAAAPATVTSYLQTLVFTPTVNQVPVGGTVVTNFTLAPSDGSAGIPDSSTQITATSINDAPIITSNGGGISASVDVIENQLEVTSVTATDPDIDTILTYSISGGADASQFTINNTSGVLTFILAPDFENPTDTDNNNVYHVQVTVTDNGSGPLTDVQSITVTVTGVNEAPEINGGDSINVNAPENQTSATTVIADDPEQDELTYMISGGADAAKFTIDSSSGVLDFVTAPDFENPADADGNNVYNVRVTVTDGSLSDMQAIAVTVIGDNDFPEITSDGGGANATVVVPENLSSVTTVTATDPDVGDTLTFSISGGIDAAKFTINSSSGALSFVTAPDFEKPTDNGGDNVYDVRVTVTDDAPSPLTDVQAIEVRVTDKGPIVIAPDTVTADATGLFTPVLLGSATVIDGFAATNDSNGYFPPGSNVVTWTTVDAGGETNTATQTVNVRPLAEFAKDKLVVENDQVEINLTVYLNGDAASYPVEIPYQVSGTATEGEDHNLSAGTISIASGRIGSMPFTVLDDGIEGELDETIIVTMDLSALPEQDRNAVAGSLSEQTFTIREDNVAPQINLTAVQDTAQTTTITKDGGSVIISATVADPNVADIHSFNWGQTDSWLIDSDTDETTFTIATSLLGTLEPGVYVVSLTVSDGALSDTATLPLRVIETAPHLLPTADHDGDGIGDEAEGIGDDDNDGIPNYLDANPLPNVLQSQEAVNDQHLIETQSGLRITLGEKALQTRDYQAEIAADQLQPVGISPDSAADYNNGIFDFRITGLPVAGQSVLVVIPQIASIPEQGVYRKWAENSGWDDFHIDSNNAIYSAAGAAGYCPAAGDAAYTEGLTAGYWCVQLLIQDGGANDADGRANREISDPGGIGSTFVGTASVSGGGGSFSALFILLLGLMYAWKNGMSDFFSNRVIQKAIYCLPLIFLGLPQASQAIEYDSWYFVGTVGDVSGDSSQSDMQSKLDETGAAITVTSFQDKRTGYKIGLGRQFTENWALEMGWLDLGDTDVDLVGSSNELDTHADVVAKIHPSSGSGFYILGQYIHPVAEKIYLFGEAGAFFWESSFISSSKVGGASDQGIETSPLFGFGVEYSWSYYWAGRLGWNHYRLDDDNVDMFSLGLVFRFSRR